MNIMMTDIIPRLKEVNGIAGSILNDLDRMEKGECHYADYFCIGNVVHKDGDSIHSLCQQYIE